MQGYLPAVVCYECSELNSAAVAADDYFSFRCLFPLFLFLYCLCINVCFYLRLVSSTFLSCSLNGQSLATLSMCTLCPCNLQEYMSPKPNDPKPNDQTMKYLQLHSLQVFSILFIFISKSLSLRPGRVPRGYVGTRGRT